MILLAVKKPFTFEFFSVVVTQEVMGMCRNCGVYDIGIWLGLKVLRMESGIFPLRSVEVLESLATVAAVDSVSEILASLGLLSLVSGEVLTVELFPDVKACGLFNRCDANGEPEGKVSGIFLTCILAFSFRAVFFCLERSAFKRIMRYASNIEANSMIMADGLTSLSSVANTKKIIVDSLSLPSRKRNQSESEEKNEEVAIDKSSSS